MKKYFVLAVILIIALTISGCGLVNTPGASLSEKSFKWQFVKSPSGNCYELGTCMSVGGFSYTISSRVDEKYCN
jgi:hypothetical protein